MGSSKFIDQEICFI